MSLLRRAEFVPPMAEPDARQLRGLPVSWEQHIAESAVDGLCRRAEALAAVLEAVGRRRDATELRRRLALLQRAEELHGHAADVETIAGLYRALSALSCEQEQGGPYERTWAQTGVLDDPISAVHGPAFRTTAALRNRAYRLVAATIARLGHAL